MNLPPMVAGFYPTKKQVIEFKGFNMSPIISDGEMRDMYNLTSDKYPNLYQRNSRGLYSSAYTAPANMLARRDNLVVMSGVDFYYGTEEVDGQTVPHKVAGLNLSAGPKQLVAINTKICIFPDKKWYNTKKWIKDSLDEFGDLAEEVQAGVSITITITTNSIAFSAGTPFENFQVGDAVEISGCTTRAANNLSAVIKEKTNTKLTFPDNTFTTTDNDQPVSSYTEGGRIKISRSVPDMDFVMESNNRLWGCSSDKNTIYASKLGDPTNWQYFQALSNDSYAVEVGTDGEFTGACACGSHLLFFKENYIHKIYGNKPANYQAAQVECYSVEKGSSKSIAVINDTVIYKSRLGVMAYTGGEPELISENFGTVKYKNAVAGTDGIKYYCSMQNGGKYELLVFDLQKGLWHKEDNTRALAFEFIKNELIFIEATSSRILAINPITSPVIKEDIKWSAYLGEYDEYMEQRKIYSKLLLRFEMNNDSKLIISVAFDTGDWEIVSNLYATKKRAVYLPITPKRCDKFRVKLEGEGYCRIESIVREYREGRAI